MSKEFQIRDGNLIASFDLENEDGDIDFCKLLKVSHGVADEIGMFVDYVATNKIIKDQSKQIADLEAKLAESEEEHELLINQFEEETEKLRKQIKQESDARKRFVEEVKNLKQQLAEKEKQLENAQNLKAIEVADELSLKLSKIHNQDKISFAVDILEELADCSNYINSKLDFESGSYVSEKSIRDKIKYLKGNKYE